MNNKKWTNRDWIWLVAILIIINIILVANVYDYAHIEANFSIISSAVSIALALVAIFIALKQDSDNQQVNNQLSHLLSEISANVRNVDAKLDLSSVGEKTVEAYSEGIEKQDTYTKEEVDKIINDVSKDITSDINDLLNKENSIETINSYYDSKGKRRLVGGSLNNIIKNNLDKSDIELRTIIAAETGRTYTLSSIKKFRKEFSHIFDAG
ncbi:hypothetical protein FC694_12185 [Bacillus wiedmannii]|uniref:Uncharacterized protein n=1 Tax=Bacillus wiedmannii TaxID=1890302 RepID=A0A4U2MYR5_9BACI|nr:MULTISPECIES: hypothetical protein [Bacillus cereus group]PFO09261.1 hypothetical protein COJ63_06065 [Bacillus cereus]TKH16586.1 hypothetical protein FC694_12185 [Bacillus wiedmannii]